MFLAISDLQVYIILDDVMSTLLSFRGDYVSSNKAQSAAQASQFKELKNDLIQLSCLVADLNAENLALRTEVNLLKNKVAVRFQL